jgi:transposase
MRYEVSMTEKRRTFTEEFKREAVRLAKESGNVAGTARDLGINESLLHHWKQRLSEAAASAEQPFPGKGNPRDQELDRLQRENSRLKEENEILKKAVGIFTDRPR